MLSIQRKLFTLIILGAIGIGFLGGIGFDRYQEANSFNNVVKQLINIDVGKPDTVDFSLFWQTWNRLHEKYVDKNTLDTKKLLYGAIQGMVEAAGDPYTTFFEPVKSQKFQEEISGTFSGVGMEIGKRDNVLTVIAPIRNSPAFRAGIQAGDRILKVNDRDTTDLSIEEAVNLIRGARGTRVTLTISPKGSNDVKNVELVRENIKIPAVELTFVGDDVAVIEIFSFNQNVDAEFKNAAQDVLKSGATRVIVDLRNNPGGLLDSAVNLAGWFLDRGNIVVIEDFGNGTRNEFKASGDASLKKYQTIILINGGSASASEILAGALRDNRNIQLIGEKSFGKGSVQQLEKFFDGSSLKVTVAKWLTPNGISISDKGIEADITVEIDPAQIESGEVVIGEAGSDPQLDRAIEEVRKN